MFIKCNNSRKVYIKAVDLIRNASCVKYLFFVDFTKAFDSIHRRKMEQILRAYGVPKETVAAITILYRNTKVKVRSPDVLNKTLTKRLVKKLDGHYTRMLRAILNKFWRQHPTKYQLYGHLPPITKTIQACRTLLEKQGRAHKRCTPMDPHIRPEQKQDGQLEYTYGSSVRIRDVAQKTYQRRWTIGRGGERGSGISVLAARHDDDMLTILSFSSQKGIFSVSKCQHSDVLHISSPYLIKELLLTLILLLLRCIYSL